MRSGRVSVIVGSIAACMLAAGCGGSSPKHAASSPAGSPQALAFSKCMRAHGVSDFPDPGLEIDGPHDSIAGIAIPASVDTQSPGFQAASSSCRAQLAAMLSPQGKPAITASMKASLIAQAQCMRTHGVPNFQDPRFPAGGGIETQDPPGVDQQSPAFQHALAACGRG